MSRTVYYGRVSTTEQNADQQRADAMAHGCDKVFLDEGSSGFNTDPHERKGWQMVMAALSSGDVLFVRWLDRISRKYDVLARTMRALMDMGVTVRCTLNGFEFDGATNDPIKKATRDALLAFMSAQGEVDYLNRLEMQRRGIQLAAAAGKYKGRPKKYDDAAIAAWRRENGATIKATADEFGINVSTVKRALAAKVV